MIVIVDFNIPPCERDPKAPLIVIVAATLLPTRVLKVVEDAVNEAQAEAWLTDATTSASADVEYIRLLNAGLSTGCLQDCQIVSMGEICLRR